MKKLINTVVKYVLVSDITILKELTASIRMDYLRQFTENYLADKLLKSYLANNKFFLKNAYANIASTSVTETNIIT